MVILAGGLAYFLRFKTFLTDVRPVIYTLPFEQYCRIVCWWLWAGWWFLPFPDFTGLKARENFYQISRILLACSTATLALIVLIFSARRNYFPPFYYSGGLGLKHFNGGRRPDSDAGLQRFYLLLVMASIILLSSAGQTTRWLFKRLAKAFFGLRVIKSLAKFTEQKEKSCPS